MRIFSKIQGNGGREIAWKDASDVLFWRYPKLQDHNTKAELLVQENQLAVVVGEKKVELYNKGRYVIMPQKANIYFIKTKPFLNVHWQTLAKEACIYDNEFGEVCIGARGVYSFRVVEKPTGVIVRMLQANPNVTLEEVKRALHDLVLEKFVGYLSQSRVALLDLTANLSEFSVEFTLAISETLKNDGIEIIDFQVDFVSLPDEVSKKIKKISTQKQPEGSILPPPLPQGNMFYIAVCGMQRGPFTIAELNELKKQGILNRGTLVWTLGMPKWDIAEKQPQLMPMFLTTPQSAKG